MWLALTAALLVAPQGAPGDARDIFEAVMQDAVSTSGRADHRVYSDGSRSLDVLRDVVGAGDRARPDTTFVDVAGRPVVHVAPRAVEGCYRLGDAFDCPLPEDALHVSVARAWREPDGRIGVVVRALWRGESQARAVGYSMEVWLRKSTADASGGATWHVVERGVAFVS